jgi:hypothetical protein
MMMLNPKPSFSSCWLVVMMLLNLVLPPPDAAFDGDDSVAFDAEDYCDDSDGDDFMCMVMSKEWGVSGISALPRWS